MTKKVRVENADNAAYKVVVQVWDKGHDSQPDTMAEESLLDYPTMLIEKHLTSTRYLVVKEA